MLAAIDPHLVGRVRVAFKAWRPLVEEYTAQRRIRAIQTRSATQVDPTQRLCASVARLVDEHAAALHQHPYFHEKVSRYGTAAQHQAQQRGHKAFRD
ncbi:hypothetical protein D3C79_966960 [compost metagenome]